MQLKDFYKLLVEAGVTKKIHRVQECRRQLGLSTYEEKDIPLYIEFLNKPRTAWNRGIPRSEETKEKISKKNKGHPAWNKGIPHSESTKQKISEKNIGQIPWNKGIPRSEECKRKISMKNKGRRHTEEEKRRVSESLKGRPAWNKGIPAWNKGIPSKYKGIPRSEETKRKIATALKGHPGWFTGRKHTIEELKKMSIGMSKAIKEGRHNTRYKFNNINFDSSWEVYFYLYHINQGHTIQRNVLFDLPHGHTFIDFEIDGQLYEIKSKHFFNKKGELIIPYNNPDKVPCEHSKERQQFYEEHNVIVIKDITFYKEWCEEKGIDISQYKVK